MGWRAGAGLTNAHTDAGEQQGDETARQAAHGSHGAPDDHGDGEHLGAAPTIRQCRDGDTQRCVKQRKGKAAEQSQLRIGQE